MYSTNHTDAQWQVIKEIQNDNGKRKNYLRDVWDAIFYITKAGCQWRMIPKASPKRESVYYYFRKWDSEGLIEAIHDEIHQMIRRDVGKEESPGLGLLDSQSVKSLSITMEKGYDGNKKPNGRKRHILTGTPRYIMAMVVHNACINDRAGAGMVLEKARHKYPRLEKILADQEYAGELIQWTMKIFIRQI